MFSVMAQGWLFWIVARHVIKYELFLALYSLWYEAKRRRQWFAPWLLFVLIGSTIYLCRSAFLQGIVPVLLQASVPQLSVLLADHNSLDWV